MSTPFITDDPMRLSRALERIAVRDRATRRRGFLQRFFSPPVPHARREHVARISPTETVHSNPPSPSR